ncbi:MAG: MoaD/ThiS family protein [Bacillota bacterium]
MAISVVLYGGIGRYLPDGSERVLVDYREGMTVGDVLDGLPIPADEIWMTSVSRQIVPREHMLSDGDELLIFAPVAGGGQD